MDYGKYSYTNSRLKRILDEEDPPFKYQRLFYQFNDDKQRGNNYNDYHEDEYDASEITEQNYKNISATSVYKKLQVLDIRDRIIRMSATKKTKNINVDDIKPMEGTCIDMCPERERLMRIHSNMVSQFECKQIDLKLEPVFELMVKQYTRSSADQANPLPHELRPTPVLVKTMNYMLYNIIHPIETNIEQDLLLWYDFCWDRLRAIRKDIVQQNLQNVNVITILEQIGRFHIACYDLMLGYSGFDIKLNTENLNNCIQMLIPMYKESDVKCPNEAEFVAYELLMHLGNPQFHTAYGLLPTRLKQTPQVRFCIEAHTIYLHSSDCIEFFKLLNYTTYMNCSILQRVIPNIRYNSIKMMNMSFTTIKHVHKLDIKHIMEKLCFDNIQSAYEFCNEVQLNCDEHSVDLSRNVPIRIPEHRRQQVQESLITQKRQNLTCLISGVEHLPDDVKIEPVQSSFTNNDRFIDFANNDFDNDNNGGNDGNDNNDESMIMDINHHHHLNSQNKNNYYPFGTTLESFSFKTQYNLLHSTTPAETAENVNNFTFTSELPKTPTCFAQPDQTSSFNFDTPLKSHKLIIHNDNSNSAQSSKSSTGNSFVPNSSQSSFVSSTQDLKNSENEISSSSDKSTGSTEENIQYEELTERQKILAETYFRKWQSKIDRKSQSIEEVFADSDLFNSECISSLSSSSDEESVSYDDNSLQENTDIREELEEWLHRQHLLAEKYFYIWLKKVLRRRRKYEMEAVLGMPWSMFMQVHGTPEGVTQSGRFRHISDRMESKTPIAPPLVYNRTKQDDISLNVADIFAKNVLDSNKDKLFGNKIFWKLAVNYGSWPDQYCIQDKVQAIIYGTTGFSNMQVQSIYTNYNTYLIKSVQSYSGLQDWKKSGLNACLIFTNTNKEDIETFFKRLESILQSTPNAIPCVLVFSSNSNKDMIKDYRWVLDAYQEKEHINNYTVYTWDGPKTILEAIEFFSLNYIDHAPGMRTENLFYNLLNFAQSFYLKVRTLLPEDEPNTIIEKYNQYLDLYIGRLGRENEELKYLAPEFISYYTRNPDKFVIERSNFNIKPFVELLNGSHLTPYESWPPQNVDDLIEYVKSMCQITNRRCWCLDILQMLQLNRKSDLEHCLLNANWYETIEMWIQGALEKCTATHDDFTVFYIGDPIAEVLKIVFPD